MPPKKARARRANPQGTRRSARQNPASRDGIPQVYREMLAEVAQEDMESRYTHHAVKRRKVSEDPDDKIDLDFDLFGSSQPAPESNAEVPEDPPEQPKLRQIVFDDFEDSESEVEFEDVELDADTVVEDLPEKEPDAKPLQLDLSGRNLDALHRVVRRKPVNAAERKVRLEVHKAHLVCLLAHLSCRNRWCDSVHLHAILKPLVSRNTVALLHADESRPQYERSHKFREGIDEVCAIWKREWTTNIRGMRRAFWKEDVDAVKESEDTEDLIDFEEFEHAAKSRSGSRDLGAQLFCALLRAVGVETRLVCSLQVLPFSAVAKGQTPEKPKPQYIHAPQQSYAGSSRNTTATRPQRPGKASKRVVDSQYPIFWVEVFSPATQVWYAVDPLVRNTFNKPKTGFEPPASDQLNSMSYVIAFEEDGSAKDVTRRYTQWFNAKTRKTRVESTKGGEVWWNRTIGVIEKHVPDDRDAIEDAELLKRAEGEPMPRNVQDFKGHPVYVLERHLRLNEVIHPRDEVGTVGIGVGKNAKLESVFRRRNVHVCRSADAWYRRGRDVQAGEQPLKRVMPRRKGERPSNDVEDNDDEGDDGGGEGSALYAEYQTSLYVPPPVVDGQIPKNAYGNLDVYVPSMIPAGAVHIRHPLAAQAARVLGIDYSDAVTGFEFKGRQGTAVVDGAVVAMSMCNAMVNVVEGLESQASEEADLARSAVLLAIWKRWLKALRVRDRIERQYGGGGGGGNNGRNPIEHTADDNDDDDDPTYNDDGGSNYGGGFVPEASEVVPPAAEPSREEIPGTFPSLKPLDAILPAEVVRRPIVVVRSPNTLPVQAIAGDDDDESMFGDEDVKHPDNSQPELSPAPEAMDVEESGGGFLVDGEDDEPVTGDVNVPASVVGTARRVGIAIDHDVEDGGGFIPDDETGGGFLVDDPPADTLPSQTREELAEETTGSTPANHEISNGQSMENADMGKPDDPATAHINSSQGSRRQHKCSSSESASETSLLSHDPEEEDAEPEWLLESLGELD